MRVVTALSGLEKEDHELEGMEVGNRAETIYIINKAGEAVELTRYEIELAKSKLDNY